MRWQLAACRTAFRAGSRAGECAWVFGREARFAVRYSSCRPGQGRGGVALGAATLLAAVLLGLDVVALLDGAVAVSKQFAKRRRAATPCSTTPCAVSARAAKPGGHAAANDGPSRKCCRPAAGTSGCWPNA